MRRIILLTAVLTLVAGNAFANNVPEPNGLGFFAAAVGALLAARLLIRK